MVHLYVTNVLKLFVIVMIIELNVATVIENVIGLLVYLTHVINYNNTAHKMSLIIII